MRLILVHGFTQTRRSWDPLLPALADRDIVALDAPGHGTASDVALDLDAGGRWLVDQGGVGAYVGYSMGARLCLHAALAAPEAVRALVLVSGTAGIDDDHERAARRASDEALADRIERIGVDPFLDEWLALPLFAGLDPATDGREARRENTPAGLASSLRRAGTGTQAPLWDRLESLRMPVLVVAGALDEKFAALAHRLAAAIPDADLAIIEGAGHTVHLEQPDAFLRVLLPWIDATGRSGRAAHADSASPSDSSTP